jgi:uncharacterized protein (TIGR02466 family)
MNAEVWALFPTTVLAVDMQNKITDEQMDLIKLVGEEIVPNEGNFSSINNYMLHDPRLSFLKQEFDNAINYYIREILLIKEETQFKITQSWLNITPSDHRHHKHSHPNSWLSAVLYLQSDENDQVTFDKDSYQQFKFYPKEYNVYNAEAWNLPVPAGRFYIFPSSLKHLVNVRSGEHKKDRISLACNTWPTGYMGDKWHLSELEL